VGRDDVELLFGAFEWVGQNLYIARRIRREPADARRIRYPKHALSNIVNQHAGF
jgi:hypothetical protein